MRSSWTRLHLLALAASGGARSASPGCPLLARPDDSCVELAAEHEQERHPIEIDQRDHHRRKTRIGRNVVAQILAQIGAESLAEGDAGDEGHRYAWQDVAKPDPMSGQDKMRQKKRTCQHQGGDADTEEREQAVRLLD